MFAVHNVLVLLLAISATVYAQEDQAQDALKDAINIAQEDQAKIEEWMKDATKTVEKRSGNGKALCSKERCSPYRYNQLTSALTGYNILFGQPIDVTDATVDPGVKNQIFDPALRWTLDHGEYKGKSNYRLHGVTYLDQSMCSLTSNAEVTTTTKKFLENTQKNSAFSASAGYKNEMTVKATAGPVSAEQKITTSVDVGFSKSNSANKVKQFFENKKGAITTISAKCITTSITLQHFDLPDFTQAFKNVIKAAAKAVTREERLELFKSISDDFGTHYMSKVSLGAQLYITKFLTQTARKDYSRDQMKKCSSANAGFNIGGFHAGVKTSKCSAKDTKNFQEKGLFLDHQTTSSRGSRPPVGGDAKKWAQQDFAAQPIRFALKPIYDLFKTSYLGRQKYWLAKDPDFEDAVKHGDAIKAWYKDLWKSYCGIYDLDCIPKHGCGYDDDCRLNQRCITDRSVSKGYRCEWACIEKDTAYKGHDIAKVYNIRSWRACSSECLARKGACKAWLWTTSSYRTLPNLCILKTAGAIQERTGVRGVISGLLGCGMRCQTDKGGCCTDSNKCSAGEGTCHTDMECGFGLNCVKGCFWDKSKKCCLHNPSKSRKERCSKFRPCNEGEGVCSSENQCAGDLTCGANNCPWGNAGCCVAKRCGTKGGGSCCTPKNQCELGEGDCDTIKDCKPGLVCGVDNCPWGANDDCCKKIRCGKGGSRKSSCCSSSSKCYVGEGDCDHNSECYSGNCGNDNCIWGGGDDCCK